MSTKDLERVYAGLCQMGVEIKKEEAQAPTRAIACRVAQDFAIQALMVSPELLHQASPLNLENYNPNSAASSYAVNR